MLNRAEISMRVQIFLSESDEFSGCMLRSGIAGS